MALKVIITQGLPGSGKSTWAKKFVETEQKWIRVNRDDLRNMMGPYWVPSRETVITDVEGYSVITALARGWNVVIDATNLSERHIVAWKDYITKSMEWIAKDIDFEVKSFTDVPIEECIRRDSLRPNPVGEKVIRDFHKRYLSGKTN